jgi:hypothetical protein
MKRATLAVALLVAVLGLMLPQSAVASTSTSWRYIVPPIQGPPDEPANQLHVATYGQVVVVPEGTTVTVTIADDVHPNGSFLFNICQRNEPDPGDSYCGQGIHDRSTGDICYTGPETLTGVTPNNPVEVTLWFATSPCPDSPITGTMTVGA